VVCGREADGRLCPHHKIVHRGRQRQYTGSKPRMLGNVSYDDTERYEKFQQKIAREYARGQSSVLLAKRYGVWPGTILKIVVRCGGTVRPKGSH